jgi:hypothetical protein
VLVAEQYSQITLFLTDRTINQNEQVLGQHLLFKFPSKAVSLELRLCHVLIVPLSLDLRNHCSLSVDGRSFSLKLGL